MSAILTRRRVHSLTARCLAGACWITWRGSGDVVLQSGESVTVRGVRGFCLEVLGRGEALVEEPAAGKAPLSIRTREALEAGS
jgi:hypothetical protein